MEYAEGRDPAGGHNNNGPGGPEGYAGEGVPAALTVAGLSSANHAKLQSDAQQLLTAIRSYPLVFASTHGVYDVRKELREFIVPPNTYVIEMSSDGYATMTHIDRPMWNLVQNRNTFERLLTAQPGRRDPTDAIYADVLKHMYIYKPGDKCYKRKLVLELGEGGEEKNNAWGYYLFTPGDKHYPFPSDEGVTLDDIPRNEILESYRKNHFYEGHVRRTERIENYSQAELIREAKRDIFQDHPVIFFMSSCAAYWETDRPRRKTRGFFQTVAIPPEIKEERRRKFLIEELHKNQALYFAQMGFQSGPISGHGNSKSYGIGRLTATRNIPSGVPRNRQTFGYAMGPPLPSERASAPINHFLSHHEMLNVSKFPHPVPRKSLYTVAARKGVAIFIKDEKHDKYVQLVIGNPPRYYLTTKELRDNMRVLLRKPHYYLDNAHNGNLKLITREFFESLHIRHIPQSTYRRRRNRLHTLTRKNKN